VILFVLAGAILVLMNRYSSFFTTGQGRAVAKPRITSTLPVVEFYDPDTGQKRGQLVAKTYSVQPDGAVDCGGVSLDLANTAFGDVALTCDEAHVKLDQIGGRFAGQVTLAGNVSVKAVKDGKTTVSGHFDKVAYDASTKDISAEGPIDVFWGEGVTVSGTDLSGNLDQARLKIAIARDVKITISAALLAARGLTEGLGAGGSAGAGEDLTVSSSGPMNFDLASSSVTFADNVKVTRGALELSGDRLRLAFTAPKEGTPAPSSWSLNSVEVDGSARLKTPGLAVNADSLLYDAEGLRAEAKGSPARIVYGEDAFESAVIDATLTKENKFQTIDAPGAGTAELSSASLPSAVAEPASDAPLKVSWQGSFHYDAGTGALALSGGVEAAKGDFLARASKIDMLFENVPAPSGAPRQALSRLDASGDVFAANGRQSVAADSVAYDRKSDTVTFRGAPASVTTPDGTFASNSFTYSVTSKVLSCPRACRIALASSAGPSVSSSGRDTPVVVTAGRVTADFSGPAMTATAAGGVKVDSGQDRLSSDTMDISGVPAEPAANEPAAAGSALRGQGRGNVKFAREALTGSGDSFAFDQSAGTVTLKADPGRRVEISYGDSATIWGDSVFVDTASETAVCEKPQVSLSAQDTVMGFLAEEPKKKAAGPAPAVKVYLKAGGKMTLTRPSPAKALLVFDGGVDGIKRDSQTGLEDTVAADTLSFDIPVESPPEGAKPGTMPKTSITAVSASGGVHIKYAAGKSPLECWGTEFGWDRAANRGRIAGSPAVVIRGDTAPWQAAEFIYDFTGRKIVVHGGEKGSFTVQR
jgi:lipopolysaccharide export system protein LptA